MKKLLVGLLIISVGVNIFYLNRKIQRHNKWREEKKLRVYKKISYEKGNEYFFNNIKKSYPDIKISNKDVIVYRWDSIHYDFIYREQLKALDSLAAIFGKHKLEFFLVTEMEEAASKSFLKRNGDDFKNLKMLFGMDDFISGLHNIKGLRLIIPTITNPKLLKLKDSSLYRMKQLSFYAIIDSERRVLYTNEGRGSLQRDTIFLNKIKSLTTEYNYKILN